MAYFRPYPPPASAAPPPNPPYPPPPMANPYGFRPPQPYQMPPPPPPQQQFAPPAQPYPPQQPPMYYTPPPPPPPPPAMSAPPPPPPPPPSASPPRPPPQPAAAAAPAARPERVETEEERRARKRREHEKQRQEERRQHMARQLQAPVLQKTQQALGKASTSQPQPPQNHQNHHGQSHSWSKVVQPSHSQQMQLAGGSRKHAHAAPTERVENRLKKPTTFLCKMKFRNELPDPSAQPKLLPVLKDKDRYSKYQITSLEKKWRPPMLPPTDLGIPLDLFDMSVYYPTSTSKALDREDEEFLRSDDETTAVAPVKQQGIRRKERPTDEGVSWLVKTQYISSLSTEAAKLSLTEKQAKEMRERKEGRNVVLENLNSREKKIQTIEDSFKAAKMRPVHQTKPHMEAEWVKPFLPDFDRLGDHYLMVNFDGQPTADSEQYSKLDRSIRDDYESKAIMKSFVASGGSEKFLAYMVPQLGEDEESEEVQYSWLREYHWEVRGDDTNETYLVTFGDKEAKYLPLSAKLVLQKKKAKEGRSGDVEHYPVPSTITVRKRAADESGNQRDFGEPSAKHVKLRHDHHRSSRMDDADQFSDDDME